MGKIWYVVVPNVAKRPRNISNPDGLSSPLKYLLAIKTNPSSLILAYPKMVRSSNCHFYNWRYLYLWLSSHPHTHSLSRSLCCLTHSPPLSVSYKYDDCACFFIFNILTINYTIIQKFVTLVGKLGCLIVRHVLKTDILLPSANVCLLFHTVAAF